MTVYKVWTESVAANDWEKAANDIMNEKVVVESKNEMAEVVQIMRGTYAKLKEAVKLLSDAGMYPENLFDSTHHGLFERLANFTSIINTINLEDADTSFVVAVSDLETLLRRIDGLLAFYNVVNSLRELTSLLDRELESYRDIQ